MGNLEEESGVRVLVQVTFGGTVLEEFWKGGRGAAGEKGKQECGFRRNVASAWSWELWNINGTTEFILHWGKEIQSLAVGSVGVSFPGVWEVAPVAQGVSRQQHLQPLEEGHSWL